MGGGHDEGHRKVGRGSPAQQCLRQARHRHRGVSIIDDVTDLLNGPDTDVEATSNRLWFVREGMEKLLEATNKAELDHAIVVYSKERHDAA